MQTRMILSSRVGLLPAVVHTFGTVGMAHVRNTRTSMKFNIHGFCLFQELSTTTNEVKPLFSQGIEWGPATGL